MGDDVRFGRHLTIYALHPKGGIAAEEVAAAVDRLAEVLTEGQPRRTGNFTRFRLLHESRENRYLLLVSADMPMSPDEQVEQMSPMVAAHSMGSYGELTLPSVTADDLAVGDGPDAGEFDLGVGISIAELRLLPGKSEDDLVAAVDSRLVRYLHEGASRIGKVVNVSLLANGRSHLVLFGLDAAFGNTVDHRLDEVSDTASVASVGFFGPLPLRGA